MGMRVRGHLKSGEQNHYKMIEVGEEYQFVGKSIQPGYLH